jgi:hypothetical protein
MLTAACRQALTVMTVPCCLRTVRAVYQQVLYGPPMETVAGTYVHIWSCLPRAHRHHRFFLLLFFYNTVDLPAVLPSNGESRKVQYRLQQQHLLRSR